jgi:hypothetical protein
MTSYTPPVCDVRFVLDRLLALDTLSDIPEPRRKAEAARPR